jgi:hypothetical protein
MQIHYDTTGPEVFEGTGGAVDILIGGVGAFYCWLKPAAQGLMPSLHALADPCVGDVHLCRCGVSPKRAQAPCYLPWTALLFYLPCAVDECFITTTPALLMGLVLFDLSWCRYGGHPQRHGQVLEGAKGVCAGKCLEEIRLHGGQGKTNCFASDVWQPSLSFVGPTKYKHQI